MAKKASPEPGKIISLPTGAVCFGPFRFDSTNATLSRGDAHIHLPPRALGVLEYLVRRPGLLVSKEELLEAVWNDVHVTEDSLTQAISLIRQALGDDPRDPFYVETVPRLGYRFVAKVSSASRGKVGTQEAAHSRASAGPSDIADTGTVQVEGDIRLRMGAQLPMWRRALPWGLAVLLLANTVSIWAWLGSQRERPAVPALPQQFDVMLPANVTIPSLSGGTILSVLAVSPDGTWIAFVGTSNFVRRLFLRNLNELEARVLRGTEGASVPFFSPDGEWLGFGAEGKLKAIPVGGGAVRIICDAPQLRGATWGDDGTILFGLNEGHLARVAASGGTPEVLVSPDPEANLHGLRWPQILPGGQAALFTAMGADFSNADDWRVLVVQLGSGETRELLHGAATARYVPTGHLLYLRRSHDERMAATLMVAPFDLQGMKLTGSAVPILEDVRIGVGSGAPYYSVSDTGLLLYVPTDPTLPKRQLVWVDRSGHVVPAAAERRAFDGLRLSPDARRVALKISWDIWVLDFDRPTWNRLTTDGSSWFPIWSPDGNNVAFSSGTSGTRQIHQVPAAGGGPAEQLTEARAQFPHDYSPDGQTLLYSTQLKRGWDIFLLPLRGNRIPQPWLQTPNLEVSAKISPNGRWVAYRSNETGRPEIYVRPYSGPGPKIPISTEGGIRPFWSRDGTEVHFLGRDFMMAVPVRMGQDLQVGTPRELFRIPKDLLTEWHQIDVSPDGRFLMIRGDPKETEPLRLVVKPYFFEELKELSPTER